MNQTSLPKDEHTSQVIGCIIGGICLVVGVGVFLFYVLFPDWPKGWLLGVVLAYAISGGVVLWNTLKYSNNYYLEEPDSPTLTRDLRYSLTEAFIMGILCPTVCILDILEGGKRKHQ